ncbi:MAG: pseudouridine synthase [Lachnospiraceae bacterium]|nr:pseudouridine synthase [Lachnospiraceae bacterium]
MEETGVRINKFIANAGVCSRREADRMIADGRVVIDDVVAGPGDRVYSGAKVKVDGNEINLVADEVVLIFNKPVGIVCTAEEREPDNVIDYIGYPERIYPVGRLDKDSRGLLILTNMGQLAYEVTRAASGHEKEYEVTVDHPITGQFMIRMQQGVYLKDLDRTTAPAAVKKTGEKSFSIILHQGLNRQIRRMCAELGYRVRDLKRVREMDLTLEGIPEGEYRRLSAKETAELKGKILRAAPSE